jgi:hypothetical protein
VLTSLGVLEKYMYSSTFDTSAGEKEAVQRLGYGLDDEESGFYSRQGQEILIPPPPF